MRSQDNTTQADERYCNRRRCVKRTIRTFALLLRMWDRCISALAARLPDRQSVSDEEHDAGVEAAAASRARGLARAFLPPETNS